MFAHTVWLNGCTCRGLAVYVPREVWALVSEENAVKLHEEEQQRKRQMALLEELA